MYCGRHQDEHGNVEPPPPSNGDVSHPDAELRGREYIPAPGLRPCVEDGQTGTEIETMDEECYLLRNLLGPREQAAIFQYVLDRDKTPWDTLPRAMVPAPKTLVLGEDQPSIEFAPGEESVVTEVVGKANEVLKRNGLGSTAYVDLSKCRSLTMAAIQYESPDGHFAPHVDHCSNSSVYLMSLGCTANFMVKGPTMESKHQFKFRSGDMLIFNASTEAAILHGVLSIDDEGSCPRSLGDAFPVLQKHRYGVQCRLGF